LQPVCRQHRGVSLLGVPAVVERQRDDHLRRERRGRGKQERGECRAEKKDDAPQLASRVVRPSPFNKAVACARKPRTLAPLTEILDLLACPVCRQPLARPDGEPRLECASCGRDYPFHLEIPILAVEGASAHKARQVEFFDQDPADDFGVTRPRGAPELYGWLLREKFRRSVIGLEHLLAGATAAAVRLGLAEDEEEAGNRVRRLTLDEISRELSSRSFRPIRPHRYAMYYRHWPGRAMRVLSTRPLLPLAQAGLNVLNRVAGRFGNKLTVQAIRGSG